MGAHEAAVGVIGAGAAGLWAAEAAARSGASVLVLEKTARTGTKVLASGGTRCNLTTTLDARAAGELFGPEGARFLRTALRELPPEAVRERFAGLGVETVEAPLEKVFPRSGRARDVRDALERAAREAGARIELGAGVAALEPLGPRGRDGWLARLADGRERRFARLVVCPGGASYPRTGTTGDGYRWLAALELPLVEPVPALVPLSSPAAWARELTGIALQEVDCRLVDERKRVVGRRARPVLFTHRGVSGPGAMDLSAHVARAHAAARRDRRAAPVFALELDLVPALDREALRALLIDAAGRAGAPTLSRALPAELPKRLVAEVARAAALEPGDPRLNGLDKAARHRLVEALKGLAVPIDGTLGFDQAEVTAGGLALAALDPGTMRVRAYENLHVCGEVLDLQGPIGGLSFQAAWSTAELAGRAAGR